MRAHVVALVLDAEEVRHIYHWSFAIFYQYERVNECISQYALKLFVLPHMNVVEQITNSKNFFVSYQ